MLSCAAPWDRRCRIGCGSTKVTPTNASPRPRPPTRRADRGRARQHHSGVLQQAARHVDAPARAEAEAKLALIAGGYRPDQLADYAQVYKDCLKPDGDFRPDEPEHTRKRGITLGRPATRRNDQDQ
ncbi:DUF222 domain-containing protein, partial [Mycobacterium kiyosense]|uniref:DUF222 domain-containing protein n=1 Tax=Mycobacterium kiyosense TaxID=2871094 RepID=UPI0035A23E68